MGKYDGKVINITETRKYKDNGNVVKKEIKNILYENKNGKYYKKIKYITTYEDGTTSMDYESFNISIEEYKKAIKL